MKTFIFWFCILFGSVSMAKGQFMPGTDFYNRNMELCDSMNKLKTITFLRNDSLFGLNIFPHGTSPTIWDTTLTYRFNFNYKLNLAQWLLDSAALVLSINAKADSATVYNKVKSDSSVLATAINLRKLNSDSINSSGYESRGKFKNDSAAFVTAIALKKNIADSNVCPTCYVSVNRLYQLRDSIVNLIPPPISVNASPGRSLNSNYTISTTRPVLVTYTDSCSVTNPLLSGTSSADVWLEYSLNSGTTWLQPASTGNKSGVSLTVTIQITNGQKGTVSAIIPANALVRQRSVTTGTASVSIVYQQETTL